MKLTRLIWVLLLTVGCTAFAAAQEEGVTFFERTRFRGFSEVLTQNDPDLSNNPIGRHRIRSLRVPDGWEVILYDEAEYYGRFVGLKEDSRDLSRDLPRGFRIHSVEIKRPARRRRQEAERSHDPVERVTLFSGAHYQGRREVLEESDADLGDNRIGDNKVSSIKVPEGYRVTLYSRRNYRGRSVELHHDNEHLAETDIGDNAVSSVWIEYDEHRGEEPEPASEPVAEPAIEEGVTLYKDSRFRGRSETFYESDPNLSDNSIGSDRASSIRVPKGYVVTLYQHTNFRGRSVQLGADSENLTRTAVGNDQVSSLRIDKKPGPAPEPEPASEPEPEIEEGVTLFRDSRFRGRSETFYESDPTLRDNPIGSDKASSIRVPEGFVVTLYQHTNFRGRSVTLTDDEDNLSRTEVGNDQVSSLRVERAKNRNRPRSDERGEGVTLFKDSNFRGASEKLYESDPNLSDNAIGNDSLSSIRVPPSYVVTLFEHANYRGRSVVLRGDEARLGNTRLGNDRASSIKIEREFYRQ